MHLRRRFVVSSGCWLLLIGCPFLLRADEQADLEKAQKEVAAAAKKLDEAARSLQAANKNLAAAYRQLEETRQRLAAAKSLDPLRFIPVEADLMAEIPQPRKLIETLLNLDAAKQVQEIEKVKELLDSTNVRRFRQLIGYYEKIFGMRWPEILDRLAGGGVVVALKVGSDPAPFLAVVQGKDQQLVRKFKDAALNVLQQELARQESKEQIQKGKYRNFETLRVGKDLHGAVVGAAILVSNQEKVLHHAIDVHLAGGQHSLARSPGPAEARKLLPPEPLAWLWFNLEGVKKQPQAKEIFVLPRNEAIFTVAAGGLLDVIGRSPFVCAGIHRNGGGLLATVRLPRGREGMPAALDTHVPLSVPPGILPLLEPKGVLASQSFYFDISKFWDNRNQLFNAQQAKGFEDADKQTGPFLLGNKLSKLVHQAGPYYRVVIVNQEKGGYQTVPGQRVPAFALLNEMRDPNLGKALEALVRGAGLVVRLQASIKLKLVEEKHGDVKIVGYRFPEDGSLEKLPNVPGDGLLFNFSPCMAVVGHHLIASSTMELCHELIDMLKKESKSQRLQAASVSRVYSSGGAEALRLIEDQLLAQTILNQALAPDAANSEVQKIINLVRNLGTLSVEQDYRPKDFRLDIVFAPKKGVVVRRR